MHRLARLSARLGLDLWIKRDDLTGFAMGGNKGRKLEYLIADALASGADTVVGCGSLQSNFVRQLAAACAMAGLSCVAVVMRLPFDAAMGKPDGLAPGSGGNALLDRLFGAELRLVPDGPWEELYDRAEAAALELERGGCRVYRIPIGGSSPLGAYAFAQAAVEVGEEFDAIVTASSSGSTHAGLASAFAGSGTRVIGIACDPEPDLKDEIADLAERLVDLEPSLRVPGELELRQDSVGAGYGVASPEGMAALRLMAHSEGIVLDPIYSAKAFAGLLRLAEAGELRGKVLFWHTGGTPALLAFSEEIVELGAG